VKLESRTKVTQVEIKTAKITWTDIIKNELTWRPPRRPQLRMLQATNTWALKIEIPDKFETKPPRSAPTINLFKNNADVATDASTQAAKAVKTKLNA
jgi:hypothetical protein